MKKLNMGGQAVLEGVLIISPGYSAMAVRKKDGSIYLEGSRRKVLSDRFKWMRWPVIRGVVNLFSQLKLGYKMLMKSADIITDETESSTQSGWAAATAAVFAIGIAVGLFFVLPSLAASFIVPGGGILLNVIEGLIRILIFICYMLSISLMKDMRRVFMYHGAEHRVLHCFENDLEPTVENANKFPVVHPSCGTSYLFLVMVVSIIVFSLLGTAASALMRVALRIILLPLVAGLSYEILKFAAKHDGPVSRIIRAPGLLLQRLTTRVPEADMIEVAAAAYKHTMEQTNA